VQNANQFVTGQKIDFEGDVGVEVAAANGKTEPLEGTFLVQDIDAEASRLRLMNAVTRQPLVTQGDAKVEALKVSTYALVGPEYFMFFAKLLAAVGLVYLVVSAFVKERVHVRQL
jgi:POT family proton-dependent oligopeptide transporter